MTEPEATVVILFPSVHHALKGERVLAAAGVPVEMVAVPRDISPDCGICARVPGRYADSAGNVLQKANVPYDGMYAGGAPDGSYVRREEETR